MPPVPSGRGDRAVPPVPSISSPHQNDHDEAEAVYEATDQVPYWHSVGQEFSCLFIIIVFQSFVKLLRLVCFCNSRQSLSRNIGRPIIAVQDAAEKSSP